MSESTAFILFDSNFLAIQPIMLKGPPLMAEKEKDYIAFCFKKSLSSSRTDIDYGALLDGKQVECNFKQNEAREVKEIFGKNFKRSRKYSRPSQNTKTQFLQSELIIVEFFEIFTALKYIRLDHETISEIESNVITHFKEHFSMIINTPSVFILLRKCFKLLSDQKKVEMAEILFSKCQQINSSDLLFDFLDNNVNTVPVRVEFINDSLWKCDSGFLLGIFLLLKDQTLVDPVVNSFLQGSIAECKKLHKFVNILCSLCSESQKISIEKKLQQSDIECIEYKLENLSINE